MNIQDLLLSGLLFMTLGCIGPNHRPAATWVSGPPEHIEEKNYVIGAPLVAESGRTLIRYKDYWIRKRVQGSVVLDRQITIRTPDRVYVFPHGRVLTNVGMIDIGGSQFCRFVDASDDGNASPLLYVKPDGTFADFIFIRDGVEESSGMRKTIQSVNSPYRLPIATTDEIDPDRCRLDYAIRYLGRDDNNIHIECLEFEGSAERPSHQDELSVPLNQASLHCKNLRIKINGCTSSELACTVLSD